MSPKDKLAFLAFLVESQPGIGISDLEKQAGFPRRTIRYYLRALKLSGWIFERRLLPDTRRRGYFPGDTR